MKFLVDQALSSQVASLLVEAGHDAIHVRAYDMHMSPDSAIFERAAAEDRGIISADTDFGTLLALRDTSKPSVIILRYPLLRTPDKQAQVIVANLPAIDADLQNGAVVIIEPSRIRIRPLPINNRAE